MLQTFKALYYRRWLHRRLRNNDAVILDTETTSLKGHMVQLAIIDMHGKPLYVSHIKPPVPIDAEATACHGISEDAVASAPTFQEVAPAITSILGTTKYVLAYNAPFDRDVVARDLEHCSLALKQELSWRCIMRIRATIERSRWKKLQGPHDALSDCQATLELVTALAVRRRHG